MKDNFMYIILMFFVMVISSCKVDDPVDPTDEHSTDSAAVHSNDSVLVEQLHGIWYLSDPKTNRFPTLIFAKNGSLYCRQTTPGWGETNTVTEYHYEVKDSKLLITPPKSSLEPIVKTDTGSCSISGNSLIVSYFGETPFIRAQRIPQLPLSEASRKILDETYSSNNPELYKNNSKGSGWAIAYDRLYGCNNEAEIKEFQPTKHSLVIVDYIRWRREGMDVGLYRHPYFGFFEFTGEAQLATDEEPFAYPYGVYDIPADTIASCLKRFGFIFP